MIGKNVRVSTVWPLLQTSTVEPCDIPARLARDILNYSSFPSHVVVCVLLYSLIPNWTLIAASYPALTQPRLYRWGVNVCIALLQLHVPTCMHTTLANGETPFITRPNASLIITWYSDCDYTNILLALHLVIEVQIHSHEIAVHKVSHDHHKDWAVCLPFVESHELCNKGLKMEYDFLRVR